MADFGVTVAGLETALATLGRYRDGADALSGKRTSIVSDAPYAYGQNYGRYRSGRLARRAGPTLFFEAGVAAIEDSADDQIGAALPRGRSAVLSAWSVLVRRGVTSAQRMAPVKTGRLRDSLHSAEGYR
jgi:hypothetical protein